MDKYDPRIRESLFSAFIGEHIEKEELFEFAAIEGASNFFTPETVTILLNQTTGLWSKWKP